MKVGQGKDQVDGEIGGNKERKKKGEKGEQCGGREAPTDVARLGEGGFDGTINKDS